MVHPFVIRPADHASYSTAKMGKSTLFASPRLLVGLNAFEPGQEHALHVHAGMDKVYLVVDGEGHGFYKPENKVRLYETIADFLDRHIGPKAN